MERGEYDAYRILATTVPIYDEYNGDKRIIEMRPAWGGGH